jgi:hypothetical protein
MLHLMEPNAPVVDPSSKDYLPPQSPARALWDGLNRVLQSNGCTQRPVDPRSYKVALCNFCDGPMNSHDVNCVWIVSHQLLTKFKDHL